VVDALGVQATTLRHASRELSTSLEEFAHPKTGALPRVNEALRWMKTDLQNAGDHVRGQMNGLGKELYRTIAVFCFCAMVIGLLAGILYQRWLDAPAAQPQELNAPTAQSAPASVAPRPNKHRQQENGAGQK